MSEVVDLKYFSFTILFVLILYMLILCIFLCIRRKEIKVRQQNRRGHDNDSYFSFEWTSSVEDVTESWMGGDISRKILFGTRIVSTLYLLFGGLVFYGSQYPASFYYFDGWTLILTTIYFVCATVLSGLKVEIISARSHLDPRLNPDYSIIDWTYSPRIVAVACHMLFEVCCASNFLCAFGVLFQASPDSDDIVIATSICICLLFLDMGLNNLKFRFDQFPASAAWVVFYLLCIWSAIFMRSMRTWPYPFMAVDSSICFYYYAMLFVAQFIAYLSWYAFFRAKRMFLYFLEFRGIVIPITPSNPYALPDYRNLEDDYAETMSQSSGYSSRSRDSLRSRNSRNSDKDNESLMSGMSDYSRQNRNGQGSVVVNSYLFTGDTAQDFGEQGIAMRAISYPEDDSSGSVYGGSSVFGGSIYNQNPEELTPEQQQHLLEQQRMWSMPIPLIPPPPGFIVPTLPPNRGIDIAGDGDESKHEEERKATNSEEELALSQQQQQQLELQQLQQQAMQQQHEQILAMQQQQQQPNMMMPYGGYAGWPPAAPAVGPGPTPHRKTNRPNKELLRAVPHLKDPVFLLEQQQQLYLFNLLHNKEDDSAVAAPLPGASDADFSNPSFPTVPPLPFGNGRMPVNQMPMNDSGHNAMYPPPMMMFPPPPPYMTAPPPDVDPQLWQEQQQQQFQQYQQHMMMMSMSMYPPPPPAAAGFMPTDPATSAETDQMQMPPPAGMMMMMPPPMGYWPPPPLPAVGETAPPGMMMYPPPAPYLMPHDGSAVEAAHGAMADPSLAVAPYPTMMMDVMGMYPPPAAGAYATPSMQPFGGFHASMMPEENNSNNININNNTATGAL